MNAGCFVWASFPFAEGDGRAKVRPAFVLAVAETNGKKVLLCAGKFSAVEKVRGCVEVFLSADESQSIGLDHREGVLRFSRQSIQAVMDFDVISTTGSLSMLPLLKQEAIWRAARAIGITL
jgi:hypothetical protein